MRSPRTSESFGGCLGFGIFGAATLQCAELDKSIRTKKRSFTKPVRRSRFRCLEMGFELQSLQLRL